MELLIALILAFSCPDPSNQATNGSTVVRPVFHPIVVAQDDTTGLTGGDGGHIHP